MLLGKFFTANIIFGSCMIYACRKKNQILKTMDKELLNKMCSCSWLYQMLSLLRQKEKLFYQWAFCFFPSLLVLARLCPVKYLTDGLVGIAFTLPTLDCFSFLHLFWTRYWISKKVRRNAQSIWKNLILDMPEMVVKREFVIVYGM